MEDQPKPPADDPANEPKEPGAVLEALQQYVADQTKAVNAGYVCLMWLADETGKPRMYYASHNFPSWRDAAKHIQPTVNELLKGEQRERGPQIILPSGAGHPRRIPR